MLINFQEDSAAKHFTFDVAIIGGGPAGMTIAHELSRQHHLNIGVIESGDLTSSIDTQKLYEIQLDGHAYFMPDGNRLRYFGGSSNHWGRQIMPIEPNVFSRSHLDIDGEWPFSYSELQPYYKKAYTDLGFPGYDEKGFLSNEFTLHAREWMNFKPKTLNNAFRRLAKTDLPVRFKKIASEAKNITVLLNANLVDISMTKDGQRISACHLKDLKTKAPGKVTARLFILACGGLENPRLLLLANRQNPKGLGNDNDLVGRYFMEHPHTYDALHLYSKDNLISSYGYFEQEGAGYIGSVELTPEFQRSQGVLSASMTWLPVEPDIDTKKMGLQVFTVGIQSEQSPNPNSRVSLSDSFDALGQRKLALDWQLQQKDIDTITKAVNLLISELGRQQLARVKRVALNSQDWPEKAILGGAHHLGTTRMSSSPASGVVDENCKVFGLQNFYIAGSSVFPSGGYANPTLTIISMAYRLADHLSKKLDTF
jgi:choline dehydrogenase-like flavoprotein